MESHVKPTEENERLARLFAALGNPLRLKILHIISSSDRPLHIKGIARIIKTRYPITYKHVKTLQQAGLVIIYEVGRSRVVSPKTPDIHQKITAFGEEILRIQ